MTHVDPDAEVRKLQELVKRLETQNEILRTQQNDEENEDSEVSFPPPPDDLTLSNDQRESSECDFLDDISSEAEDSWLYSSPDSTNIFRNGNYRDSSCKESPLSWMRADLNCPTPEESAARRCLATRLDEFRMVGRSNYSEISTSQNFYQRPHPAARRLFERQRQQLAQSNNDGNRNGDSMVYPSIRAPLIDTQTISRQERLKKNSDQNATSSSPPVDRMADLMDVRIVARMQEQALKAQVQASNNASRSRTSSVHSGSDLSPSNSYASGLNSSYPEESSSVRAQDGTASPTRMLQIPRRSLPSVAGVNEQNGFGRGRVLPKTPVQMQRQPSPSRSGLPRPNTGTSIPKMSGIPRPGGSAVTSSPPAPITNVNSKIPSPGQPGSPMRAIYKFNRQ